MRLAHQPSLPCGGEGWGGEGSVYRLNVTPHPPASAVDLSYGRGEKIISTRLQVTSFSPTMPARISPTQPRRSAVAGSANRIMPRIDSADGADTGPDGVGGADRQRFQGQPQKGDAEDHRDDGADRRPELGKAVGSISGQWPIRFQEDQRRKKIGPGRGGVPFVGAQSDAKPVTLLLIAR